MQVTTIATPAIQGHIAVVNGQPTTTTQDIADVFSKRHDDVLRVVRQRMSDAGEWRLRNFTETVTERQNPSGGAPIQSPVIRMTEAGFMFVVGKFTGKRAVEAQLAYVDEFMRMREALRTIPDPTLAYRATDMLAKTAKALRDSGIPRQQALAQALGIVRHQTGVDLLPDYTPERAKEESDEYMVIKYIGKAKRYGKDKKYGPVCAQGQMPRNKLMGLTKTPAEVLGEIIARAIAQGLIEEAKNPGCACPVYVLARQ